MIVQSHQLKCQNNLEWHRKYHKGYQVTLFALWWLVLQMNYLAFQDVGRLAQENRSDARMKSSCAGRYVATK